MAVTDIIKAKLPQELRTIAGEYTIPDAFVETLSDLIILVLNSKSMDTKEEKQSWFNLLPMMNQEQIDKLRDILTREKKKLEEIEQKYEQKKQDIITKYVTKFDESAYQKNMSTLKQEEAVHDKKEDAEADQLLNQI